MSSGADLTPIWDIDQVAAYLKVPKATLYRWRSDGSGPPARRIGRHLRYKPSEVVDWFDNLDSRIADEQP